MMIPEKDYEISVWFQPHFNFDVWLDRGVNTIIGPELENPAKISAVDWCKRAADRGMYVIANVDFRPPNLRGFFIPIDEPNGHKTPPDQLRSHFERFRAIDKNVPIYVSFAGSEITGIGDNDSRAKALYEQYGQFFDRCWVNFYSANREAARYPMTHTALAVRKLKRLLPGKWVGAAIECSDQLLSGSTSARCPTPDEMEGTIFSSILAGTDSIMYFPTATGSRKKPDGSSMGWPERFNPVPANIHQRMKRIEERLQRFAYGMADNATVVPVPTIPPEIVSQIERLGRIEKRIADLLQ